MTLLCSLAATAENVVLRRARRRARERQGDTVMKRYPRPCLLREDQEQQGKHHNTSHDEGQ